MIEIKKAIYNDLHDIFIIGKNNIHVYYSLSDLKEKYMNKFDRYFIYKIISNNFIIGFVIYEKITNNHIHILSFGFNKTFQCKGVGTAVLNFIKEINKNKKISLNVQTSNLKAINCYFKNGFKAINFFHNYYSNKNDARDALKLQYDP